MSTALPRCTRTIHATPTTTPSHASNCAPPSTRHSAGAPVDTRICAATSRCAASGTSRAPLSARSTSAARQRAGRACERSPTTPRTALTKAASSEAERVGNVGVVAPWARDSSSRCRRRSGSAPVRTSQRRGNQPPARRPARSVEASTASAIIGAPARSAAVPANSEARPSVSRPRTVPDSSNDSRSTRAASPNAARARDA